VRIFRHPSFPDITTNCTHDEGECDHADKGWLPLLNDEQMKRFTELELETELAPETRSTNPRS
jgi:hypothetical protein